MCYPQGSIDQAIGVCPMCKVFRPSGARCPHLKDVCRNRALHPRHDVVYLKNAEVQTFNGCGYCKWARTNPPLKASGYQNPGWPGCCRPPSASEYKMIPAADWLAVSIVHHVPIPAEIKSLLDTLSKGTPSPGNVGRGGNGSPSSATPPLDRRNSDNQSPQHKVTPGKSTSMMIPSSRHSASPKQIATPLGGAASKGSKVDIIPSSLPEPSAMEQFQNNRRRTDSAERRPDHSTTHSHASPVRRALELEGSVARRTSSRRPTITAAASPSMSVTKVTVDAEPRPQIRRRASISSTSSLSPKGSSPNSRGGDHQQQSASVAARSSSRRPALEVAMANVKITPSTPSASSSTSSSSSGGGSVTDGTVTSDGGFTDYLSDESEAELQRQAEAKAALVRQNQQEEMEFRAARERLTHVDLRPPKAWNPQLHSNGTPRSAQMQPSATRA